ncbi:basic salivary proline-rich protein 1-like isoform X12 [Lepisosteus oculatus]|uniref:basic salivary proline-rich protein 1-like isoform X12 n=1 Tax=Lepisosteus oculatus TaxID=7918 RepID=UPI0035F501D9
MEKPCFLIALFVLHMNLTTGEVSSHREGFMGESIHLKVNSSWDEILWKYNEDKIAECIKSNGKAQYYGIYRGRVSLNCSDGSLTIYTLTSEDKGEYSAELQVTPRTLTEKISLEIFTRVPKPVVNCTVTNSEVILECKAKSTDTTYRWSSTRSKIEDGSIIQKLRNETDDTEYICIASNERSEARSDPIKITNCIRRDNLPTWSLASIAVGSCAVLVIIAIIVSCYFYKKEKTVQPAAPTASSHPDPRPSAGERGDSADTKAPEEEDKPQLTPKLPPKPPPKPVAEKTVQPAAPTPSSHPDPRPSAGERSDSADTKAPEEEDKPQLTPKLPPKPVAEKTVRPAAPTASSHPDPRPSAGERGDSADTKAPEEEDKPQLTPKLPPKPPPKPVAEKTVQPAAPTPSSHPDPRPSAGERSDSADTKAPEEEDKPQLTPKLPPKAVAEKTVQPAAPTASSHPDPRPSAGERGDSADTKAPEEEDKPQLTPKLPPKPPPKPVEKTVRPAAPTASSHPDPRPSAGERGDSADTKAPEEEDNPQLRPKLPPKPVRPQLPPKPVRPNLPPKPVAEKTVQPAAPTASSHPDPRPSAGERGDSADTKAPEEEDKPQLTPKLPPKPVV